MGLRVRRSGLTRVPAPTRSGLTRVPPKRRVTRHPWVPATRRLTHRFNLPVKYSNILVPHRPTPSCTVPHSPKRPTRFSLLKFRDLAAANREKLEWENLLFCRKHGKSEKILENVKKGDVSVPRVAHVCRRPHPRI